MSDLLDKMINAYEKMSATSLLPFVYYMSPKVQLYLDEYLELCKKYENSKFLRAKITLFNYKHFGVRKYARHLLPD